VGYKLHDDIETMARSGLSTPDIARQLYISEATVCRVRQKRGCSAPNPAARKYPIEAYERARELLLQGHSYKQAADESGVSYSTLKRKIQGLGWDRSQAGVESARVQRNRRNGSH